jgi:hypothetical protein
VGGLRQQQVCITQRVYLLLKCRHQCTGRAVSSGFYHQGGLCFASSSAIIIFNATHHTHTHALYEHAGAQWRVEAAGVAASAAASHLLHIHNALLLFVLHARTPLSGRKRSIRVAHCQAKLGHLMDSYRFALARRRLIKEMDANYFGQGKLL